jgi:hypothetical protein
MIIFLDFDGVLHPECDGSPVPEEMAFCHLQRFESVMRDFPAVEIVISSTWRYQFPIEKLKAWFSEDIQARIIGTTPLIEREEGKYLPARREGEILQWLAENGRRDSNWIAIDDAAWQFLNHRSRLIACVPWKGFNDQAATALRNMLGTMLDDRP